MITPEIKNQVNEILKRINSRLEHPYAAATYVDVPDLKEIDKITRENCEDTVNDLNFLFEIDLYLADRYTSLGRFSISANYNFDALKVADLLSNTHHHVKAIKGDMAELFSNLLRDRNFYVDDDCKDCLELAKHTGLYTDEELEHIYNRRMQKRRNIKTDPVEMSPEYLAVIDEVEKKIAENSKFKMGFCFETWELKEIYLGEKGIKWSSPASLNPRVMFD